MKPYTERIAGTDVAFDMVPIPGGRFAMGSPSSEPGRSEDEGPQREVELEPFWMGKCEVTWAEFDLWATGLDRYVRAAKGAQVTERDRLADAVTMPSMPFRDTAFGMGRDGSPAVSMTQLAAKMYARWLSAKTGRYYRLPTEAEWEYACRAGSRTAYSFGDDPSALGEYAWYAANSGERYHPVGQRMPNQWGLCDMHGNVAEWVLDRYSRGGYARFGGDPIKDPLIAPDGIHPRVVRGGSWIDELPLLRSAARRHSVPEWSARDPNLPRSAWWHTDAPFAGFRVVRPLRRPMGDEADRYDLDAAQREALKEYLSR